MTRKTIYNLLTIAILLFVVYSTDSQVIRWVFIFLTIFIAVPMLAERFMPDEKSSNDNT